MTLIDPAFQSPEKAGEIARNAEAAGTDYIMIGGSTSITREKLDETIKKIKIDSKLKVIIFPGSSETISPLADAIYFMTLLNSSDPEYIIGHQTKAAPLLRKMGIETISMAYLVFSPGMTVGRVGKAKLIPNDGVDEAVGYSVAAEMLGLRLIYLEAGSGASQIVNPEIIKAVRQNVSLPLIVGGGIRSRESVRAVSEAGADIVVTGTIVEQVDDVTSALQPLIATLRTDK